MALVNFDGSTGPDYVQMVKLAQEHGPALIENAGYLAGNVTQAYNKYMKPETGVNAVNSEGTCRVIKRKSNVFLSQAIPNLDYRTAAATPHAFRS